jgi:hypothetical protein
MKSSGIYPELFIFISLFPQSSIPQIPIPLTPYCFTLISPIFTVFTFIPGYFTTYFVTGFTVLK